SCAATSEILPHLIEGSFAVPSASCTVDATCGSAWPVPPPAACARNEARHTNTTIAAADVTATRTRRVRCMWSSARGRRLAVDEDDGSALDQVDERTRDRGADSRASPAAAQSSLQRGNPLVHVRRAVNHDGARERMIVEAGIESVEPQRIAVA